MRIGSRRTAVCLLLLLLAVGTMTRSVFSGIHRKRAKVLCKIPGRYRFDRGLARADESVMSGQVDLQSVSNVLRRRFPFGEPALEVGDIRLSRVGIALYQTGRLIATAELRNNADAERPARSRRVSLWIRAFGSAPGDVPLANAPVVWQKLVHVHVRQGRRRHAALFNADVPVLKRHFNEIDHIELNLQYDKADVIDGNGTGNSNGAGNGYGDAG